MKQIVLMILLPIFLHSYTLEGIYKTESFLYFKSALVEFFKFNGKYYAYAIANTDGSPAKKDSHNPNKSLRGRSDKGVVFLYDLVQTSPNTYKSGRAYNFYNGSTYYISIRQKTNGDLIFFSSIDSTGFIGKSFLWKRLDENFLQEHQIKKPDFSQTLETISQINP